MSQFSKVNFSERSAPMPTTKRQVDGADGEFYPTPTWATEALLAYEHFVGSIHEPACGDGAIAKVLIQKTGIPVYASDLYDRGYGQTGVDFLENNDHFDNVITNPPYALAGEFVIHALERTSGKVAMFLRLAFLEGVERYEKIFSEMPPGRVYVFPNRVTLYPATIVDGETVFPEKKGGGTTPYAWFIWDIQFDSGMTEVYWINPSFKTAGRKRKS